MPIAPSARHALGAAARASRLWLATCGVQAVLLSAPAAGALAYTRLTEPHATFTALTLILFVFMTLVGAHLTLLLALRRGFSPALWTLPCLAWDAATLMTCHYLLGARTLTVAAWLSLQLLWRVGTALALLRLIAPSQKSEQFSL